jgi:hypothetical protein
MKILVASAVAAAFVLVSFGADACFVKRSGYAAPKMSRVAAKKPAATPAAKWGTKQMYGR